MKNTQIAILIAALTSTSALADLKINGFANFTGGLTLDSNESLDGYNDTFSFEPDSSFGLQVRSDVSDKLAATAQIVGRAGDSYSADFEWAYMTYALTNSTNISAGRLRLPLFKYSSSLDVGYSYHWLTPPTSVYNVDFNNIDGVRVDYSTYSGDWEYGVQFTGGVVKENDAVIAGSPATLQLDNVLAVSFEASRDWFSLRTLYGVSEASAENEDFTTFVDGLSAFSAYIPAAGTAASNLDLNEDSASFFEIAVNIDKYSWFVGAEFTQIKVDESLVADNNNAYYVTAGFRYGKFTPHITYEVSENGISTIEKYIASLPSDLGSGDTTTDATWAYLYSSAQGLVAAQEEDQHAVTLGVRYDMEPRFAVKAEVKQYVDSIDDSNDATLLKVGVNYTF